MSDDSSRAIVSSRRIWWAVAGVVVVTAAVFALVAVMHRARPQPPATEDPTTPAGASATPPRCDLRVVESGFSNQYGLVTGRQVPADAGQINWGLIIENPCPQAAVNIQMSVEAVDASGSAARGSVAMPRKIPAVMPGQRMGVVGAIPNDRRNGGSVAAYDATTVTGIKVTSLHAGWTTPAEVAQPPTFTARNIALGARSAESDVPITYTLEVDPPRDFGDEWMAIVVRDAAGKIVSGQARTVNIESGVPPSGQVVHTSAWVPATAPNPHVDIYFVRGGF